MSAARRWRIDLHVHTEASYDCLSPVDAVVRTARARGLDRLAITDHNAIEGALAASRIDRALVIVGAEMKTAEGIDVTGLFLREPVPRGLPAVETARAIREQGGLVYLPHPFAGGKGAGAELLETLAPWIDVVEVFNARIHRRALNERAAAWARAHARPGGAGSDAHTLDEIARAVVEVPPFDGRDGFLDALRAGRVVGSSSGPHVHLFSTWAKWRKAWTRAGGRRPTMTPRGGRRRG